jgi:GNAT superfamily N-acetyltransferase/DNA-binding transcriptional ArsR family regulator
MPAVAPSPEPGQPPPRRQATAAETRALAHPLRLRIIRLLYDVSLTNRELARALDEHPATVLHHVRTLLRTGFIAAEPERPGPRGTVEKPYRSTGRSWSLKIEDDRGLADVARAAFDAFVAEVNDAYPVADLHTSRLAVNLTPQARLALDERLGRVLAEYAVTEPDPAGEPCAVFVATHRRAPLTPEEADAGMLTSAEPRRDRTPGDVALLDRAPDDDMAVLLVRAQWAELSARYGQPEPEPESIRNPGAFRAPTGAFLGLDIASEAAGCGGLCRCGDNATAGMTAGATAELKAVYVAPLHRGHGYGRLIVQALEARAAQLGYRAVRLETGDAQPEAIALYRSLGYSQIDRFGVYRDLPRSLCFERVLET